ncbi:MAG TPA: hypothetical protein VH164_13375 [Ktedonobacteraceae bacterium]|nr:hypothetical protein [Ktedonobacteraceae bacterium]
MSGSQYVRETDPVTSYEAAEALDPESASAEALAFLLEVYTLFGLTAAQLYQHVWLAQLAKGKSKEEAHSHAETMRRRLQPDLIRKGWVETRRDAAGKVLKRGPGRRKQIYWLRGCWEQIGKRWVKLEGL